MKKLFFMVVSLAPLLVPGNVRAEQACGTSYMILPDGSCLNLDYTTALGVSRSQKAQANSQVQQLNNTQAKLEQDRRRSVAERAAKCEQERIAGGRLDPAIVKQRQEACRKEAEASISVTAAVQKDVDAKLATARKASDKANIANQSVEDQAYLLHQRAMSTVERAFILHQSVGNVPSARPAAANR